MLFEPIDEWNWESVIDHLLARHYDEVEVRVHFALDAVRAEPQIDESLAAQVGVVLVERVVKALVEFVQVEKEHRAPNLHRRLYCVDVIADLLVFQICREFAPEDCDRPLVNNTRVGLTLATLLQSQLHCIGCSVLAGSACIQQILNVTQDCIILCHEQQITRFKFCQVSVDRCFD